MAAMSVTEAAKESGLSVPTIRRLIQRREIGYCRIGRRVVVPTEELEKFIKARLVPVGTRSGSATNARPRG